MNCNTTIETQKSKVNISIWGRRRPTDLEDCLWEGSLEEIPAIGSVLWLDDAEFQVESVCLDDEAKETTFLVDVVFNTGTKLPILILI